MANEEQVALLKQGSRVWNTWRKENPTTEVDLSHANLGFADLSSASLIAANLSFADLSSASLIAANLDFANLSFANLIPKRYEAGQTLKS